MKAYWVIIIALAFFSGTLVSGTIAFGIVDQCDNDPAQGKSKGAPFLELWTAICDLQTQIDTLELTEGPQGEEGPAGADGATGPTGAAGTDTLGSLSCTTDQIARFNGAIWVCVNQFDFSSTQTRKLVIGANEFQPRFSTMIFDGQTSGGSRFIFPVGLGSNSPPLFAPIHIIPDGAIITKLECFVIDDSAANRVNCQILASSTSSASIIQVSSLIFTDVAGASSSVQTIFDSSIGHVVDRDLNAYWVRYFPSNSSCGGLCQIHEVAITYTVTQAK